MKRKSTKKELEGAARILNSDIYIPRMLADCMHFMHVHGGPDRGTWATEMAEARKIVRKEREVT